MSQPGSGIACDHLLDPGIGVPGVPAKFATLEPGELHVARETGWIVEDRLAEGVRGCLVIRFEKQALALKLLELGKLPGRIDCPLILLQRFGRSQLQESEVASGIRGTLGTKLQGEVDAATFQGAVVGVVAQRLLVDQIEFIAAIGSA